MSPEYPHFEIRQYCITSQPGALNIDSDQISMLLLTRTYSDHTGSTALYKIAAVHMHRDDNRRLTGQPEGQNIQEQNGNMVPISCSPTMTLS